MKTKKNKGFFDLAKKSLAIVSAFLTVVPQNELAADPLPSLSKLESENPGENFGKKIQLKHKLVLRLNLKTMKHTFVARHGSHSSHASHASSSPAPGHSSHTSHLSSSPSYTPNPTYSTPSSAPSGTTTTTTTSSGTTTDSDSGSLTYYTLGSRVVTKGCSGTDVQQIQSMLIKLGYTTLDTGYFGDKTEAAVKKFQSDNELNPTGKVDSQTLKVLQSK